MIDKYNYPLLRHNTFGIDVRADRFLAYDSTEELQNIIADLRRTPLARLLHIGGGSNLLFIGDFHGTILHSNIKGITPVTEEGEHIVLRVGAGMLWDDLVDYCCEKGYHGLENLSLIPGEVGAAAVQNIGAYGVEIEQFVEQIEAVSLTDGSIRLFGREDCRYAYRYSVFKDELRGQYAITYVSLRLSKVFVPCLDYAALRHEIERIAAQQQRPISARQLRDTVIAIRRSKIPDTNELGSGGSFFMNPVVSREVFLNLRKDYPQMPFFDLGDAVKIPAGWLIEQCGWKGKRYGNAGVYEKQALILVNHGGCSGEEVAELSHRIVTDVKRRFDIDIQPEINFI